jgi:peptidoglycan-associated lipoprotein
MRLQPTRAAALLVLLVVAACGPKRPPAVATGARDAAPAEAESTDEAAQPLEAGPDIQSIEGEGLGQDVLDTEAALSGEGGPLSDIFFGYDQASLTDESRATLEKHALWLQTQRNARVRLEGHCDERGTVDYNLALGDQRAQAARDYLLSLGVAPGRLEVVSYGKERPLDLGHDDAAWAKNRRVHFAVTR